MRGVLKGEIEANSPVETALFAVCTATFMNPAKSHGFLPVLRKIFGPERFEYLLLFIGFIRMAHYWTQVHPELQEEEDLDEMMKQLEDLSWALAWEPPAGWSTLGQQVFSDLSDVKDQTRSRKRFPVS